MAMLGGGVKRRGAQLPRASGFGPCYQLPMPRAAAARLRPTAPANRASPRLERRPPPSGPPSSGASAGKAGARAKSPGRRSFGGLLFRLGIILLIWGLLALGAALIYFTYDMPRVDAAMEHQRRPSVTLQTTEGGQLANQGDLYGETLRLRGLRQRTRRLGRRRKRNSPGGVRGLQIRWEAPGVSGRFDSCLFRHIAPPLQSMRRSATIDRP